MAYDGDGSGSPCAPRGRRPGRPRRGPATPPSPASTTWRSRGCCPLHRHHPRQTYVDYAALAASDEARLQLDQYLALLDVVTADQLADDAERRAYWFNAYNAAVLRGVLTFWGKTRATRWPTRPSSSSTSPSGPSAASWSPQPDRARHHPGRRGPHLLRTLDDAGCAALARLHTGLWGGEDPDPRVHVALVCASLSCPNLAAATPGLPGGHPRRPAHRAHRRVPGRSCQGRAGPAGISSLFLWYAPDFARAGYTGAEDFIARHRAGARPASSWGATCPTTGRSTRRPRIYRSQSGRSAGRGWNFAGPTRSPPRAAAARP
ncbi:MAG: hypothetical protein R3F43_01355 [bacterium]